MKKFYVLLVVIAMVFVSSIALAMDVTVGGSVQVRSRNFNTMTFDKDNKVNQVDTQERVIIDVSAKSDHVKGKISLWNDFEDWGRLESNQGNGFGSTTSTNVNTSGGQDGHFGFKEAWLSFDMPGIPINVTAGHQYLQLGNGWFLQNKHFGSDAWVVANVTGANTLAFVDIKVLEGSAAKSNDDADAYALLDVFKINDDMSVGIDIADVYVRQGAASPFAGADLQNFSLNFNGKFGIVKLMAQADMQAGKIKNLTGAPEPKFKGYEIVLQGNVGMDPVTINFLLAQGSGSKKGETDIKQYINFLDINPRYTFLYEYKLGTAANGGPYAVGGNSVHTGFANTTAASVGAMFAASQSVGIGLDLYWLQATEKITNGLGEESDELGYEIDAKLNWKLYDNLSWNWDFGYFKPGKAFKTASGKTDAAMGAQGILALKF
ncbi:MAG: hypothetical protein LUO89_01520 [Methanothrix sp.]|nr:hypothetical protein [Methanothrix sp.]